MSITTCDLIESRLTYVSSISVSNLKRSPITVLQPDPITFSFLIHLRVTSTGVMFRLGDLTSIRLTYILSITLSNLMARDLIPGGTWLKNPKCLGCKNHPIVPNLSRLDSHGSGLSFKPRQSPIGQELGEIEAKYSRDTCAPSPKTSRAAPTTFPSPMDLSHLLESSKVDLNSPLPNVKTGHLTAGDPRQPNPTVGKSPEALQYSPESLAPARQNTSRALPAS